jgi:alpha-methylacyl-CoA racemase
MAEAPGYPHHAARGTFATVAGASVAAAPIRFDGAGPPLASPPVPVGADTDVVLGELGVDPAAIAALRDSGVVA